jgi:transcriptional regulator with XRE-family HTH domain
MSAIASLMATITTDLRDAEAAALRALYEDHGDEPHKAFAKRTGLASAAMVWQYLSGHRPLNLAAASRFAGGLGVPVRQFSPRLDAEFREIARTVHGVKPSATQFTQVREIHPGDASACPLPSVDRRKLQALDAADLLRLDGALILAAGQLGLDIRKERAA